MIRITGTLRASGDSHVDTPSFDVDLNIWPLDPDSRQYPQQLKNLEILAFKLGKAFGEGLADNEFSVITTT